MIKLTRRIVSAIRFRMIVHRLADRVYMREVLLPGIAATRPANVLLVGTRRYNVKDPSILRARDTRVWTMDLDPAAARWGHGEFHRTGDVCDLVSLFGDVRFDVVLANGILGFGIDSPEATDRMMQSVADSMQPGGHLMIGWDADRIDDPHQNDAIVSRFRPAGRGELPARHRVAGCAGFDHVFDWFAVLP